MRPAVRSILLTTTLALLAPTAGSLTAPGVAFAQPKKSLRDSLPPAAQKHWDSAMTLAGRKDWDGARASFKAAYDASKNPRVLFNWGIAERELKRYAAAIDKFKQELAEGKGQLTPDEEKELASVIAGLEKYVGTLQIEASEPGTDIYIDDEKVDPAKLSGPISAAVGQRRVRGVKAGFAETIETPTVSAGTLTKVALKMQAFQRTARVNISVVGPSNAIVRVDGKDVGPAPYAGQVNVSADPHSFSAEAPGYVSATQSAVVKEGEVLNLTLQLSAEQEKGKLVVNAKPEGATIEIDGKVVGATHWEGPVDARTHQVVVKKPGYYTWTYDVDVPRGGERPVSATLNEDRNTSFVPWLIGTAVVGTALIVGIILVATAPDERPVDGTLNPPKIGTSMFGVGTPGFRF